MTRSLSSRAARAARIGVLILPLLALFAPHGVAQTHPGSPSIKAAKTNVSVVGPVAFTPTTYSNVFLTVGSESAGSPGFAHLPSYVPNTGGTTFGPQYDFTFPADNIDGTDVANLDNDSDNDFLLADGTAGNVLEYVNNGSGTFTPTPIVTGITSGGAGAYTSQLRIADFNNDGLQDFVVGDYIKALPTKVYFQGPIGTFTGTTATLDTTGIAQIFGVAAGDINGDSRADVLLMDYFAGGADTGAVWAFISNGTTFTRSGSPLFNIKTDSPGGTFYPGIALFDYDNDGDNDVVVEDGQKNYYVYTNNGSGAFTFNPSPILTAASFPNGNGGLPGIDAFDANGDGYDDLVIVSGTSSTTPTNHTVDFVLNNGNGTFATPVQVATAGYAFAIGAPPLVAGAVVTIVYDACIQDNTHPEYVLQWNTTTGEYLFCNGVDSFTGVGKVNNVFGTYVLNYSDGRRSVTGKYNPTTARGNGTFQDSRFGPFYKITDTNTNDDSCECVTETTKR